MRNLLAATLLTISACGPTVNSQTDSDDVRDDADAGAPSADARTSSGPVDPPDFVSVYAHSATELYELDPASLSTTSVGVFAFAGEPENITDLAVDKSGRMLAISLNSVFRVDRKTAEVTHLSTFPQGEGGLTSLSFVPIDLSNPDSEERLVAADFDGVVWEIDPDTGARSELGNYNASGSAIGSSGDIVSVSGFGTLATVRVAGSSADQLARIDPTTWEATLLGDIGVAKIFGIGFWRGQVYGFTDGKQIVRIDPSTGAVLDTRQGATEWWGAGVSTLAPIVD